MARNFDVALLTHKIGLYEWCLIEALESIYALDVLFIRHAGLTKDLVEYAAIKSGAKACIFSYTASTSVQTGLEGSTVGARGDIYNDNIYEPLRRTKCTPFFFVEQSTTNLNTILSWLGKQHEDHIFSFSAPTNYCTVVDNLKNFFAKIERLLGRQDTGKHFATNATMLADAYRNYYQSIDEFLCVMPTGGNFPLLKWTHLWGEVIESRKHRFVPVICSEGSAKNKIGARIIQTLQCSGYSPAVVSKEKPNHPLAVAIALSPDDVNQCKFTSTYKQRRRILVVSPNPNTDIFNDWFPDILWVDPANNENNNVDDENPTNLNLVEDKTALLPALVPTSSMEVENEWPCSAELDHFLIREADSAISDSSIWRRSNAFDEQPPRRVREHVKTLVVCALKEEKDEVLKCADSWVTLSSGGETVLAWFGTGVHPLPVVVHCLNGAGRVSAAIKTARILPMWSFRDVIICGIAGKLADEKSSGHARIGDIVLGDSIIDYEHQKIKDEKVDFRPELALKPQLVGAMYQFAQGDWKSQWEAIKDKADALLKSGFTRRQCEKKKKDLEKNFNCTNKECDTTKCAAKEFNKTTVKAMNYEVKEKISSYGQIGSVKSGLIFSGDKVIASAKFQTLLLESIGDIAKQVEAVEMEAAGVAKAISDFCQASSHAPKFGVVRSICDNADGEKDDCFHPLAAFLAARFVVGFVQWRAKQ